ncbi:MAG TPA: ankyrin repeat domain-containing protein, partial [Terriglobia bacterium]|nr:ankyrin repeat domain-containing protein [Terriglobia bacterium]
MTRRFFNREFLGSAIALSMSALILAAPDDTRLPDAVMRGDGVAARNLLKQSVDVNSAQGDGMTALHWAASREDVELAQSLIAAGADVQAATRNGGITPVWLAAQAGNARMVEILIKAGANPDAPAIVGLTPLMEAASAGSVETIRTLIARGADVNAKETTYGQTPLMFAAAFNHPEAIDVLVDHGADIGASTRTRSPGGGAAPRGGAPGRGGAGPRGAARGGPGQRGARGTTGPRGNAPGQAATPAAPPAQPAAPANPDEITEESVQPGNAAARVITENQGGLTPLLYATRQGHVEAVRALLGKGAKINQVGGDGTTPLLMAVINGHFDLAMELLEKGGDPKIASAAGATPLYRTVDVQWAPKSFYPQPSTKQERTGYLDLMKALLEHGADPNARLLRQLWYTGYGFELEGVDPSGATTFWRAAEVGDLDAMKLLVAHGADPSIATNEGVPPLLVAAGDGFHGNDAITVPGGRLPAVKFLVEDCHADVNATDEKGGADTSIEHTHTRTYTPLHAAAARGDNEMILYLVSRGARI